MRKYQYINFIKRLEQIYKFVLYTSAIILFLSIFAIVLSFIILMIDKVVYEYIMNAVSLVMLSSFIISFIGAMFNKSVLSYFDKYKPKNSRSRKLNSII